MENITLEDAVEAIEDTFQIKEKTIEEKMIDLDYKNKLLLNRLMNIQFENEVFINERLKKENKQEEDIDENKKWNRLLMKETHEDVDPTRKTFAKKAKVTCTSSNVTDYNADFYTEPKRKRGLLKFRNWWKTDKI